MKFGEFYIVQACKDASKKNHPVEAKNVTIGSLMSVASTTLPVI